MRGVRVGVVWMILSSSNVYSQEGDNIPAVRKKTLIPFDNSYEKESEWVRLQRELAKKQLDIASKEKMLNELLKELGVTNANQLPTSKKDKFGAKIDDPFPDSRVREKTTNRSQSKRKKRRLKIRKKARKVMPILTFFKEGESDFSVKIPVGSYVYGTLLSGVDASPNQARPVTVEIDSVVFGPNRKTYDLKGCRVTMKVVGDLSAERGFFQGDNISCQVGDRTWEKPFVSYATGVKWNHYGLDGRYESRQGRKIATAILANFLKGFGEALAFTQIEESLSDGDNPTKSRNYRGTNPLGYATINGVKDASTMIADYAISEARKLMPFIGIDSSRKVVLFWVKSLEISKSFLEELEDENDPD